MPVAASKVIFEAKIFPIGLATAVPPAKFVPWQAAQSPAVAMYLPRSIWAASWALATGSRPKNADASVVAAIKNIRILDLRRDGATRAHGQRHSGQGWID